MKSYESPPGAEGLSVTGARRAANRLRAEILADARHPYNDGGHPQHADYSDYFRDLNRIIREGADADAEGAELSELGEALGEDAGLDAAGMEGRARELIRTPGYLDGRMLEKEKAQLARKIHALHQAARLQKTSPTDEPESELEDES